jgi:Ran GTPase-activating protein (RanGAP) involved in mRNA processing and transport
LRQLVFDLRELRRGDRSEVDLNQNQFSTAAYEEMEDQLRNSTGLRRGFGGCGCGRGHGGRNGWVISDD